jgi:hypothetical protein
VNHTERQFAASLAQAKERDPEHCAEIERLQRESPDKTWFLIAVPADSSRNAVAWRFSPCETRVYNATWWMLMGWRIFHYVFCAEGEEATWKLVPESEPHDLLTLVDHRHTYGFRFVGREPDDLHAYLVETGRISAPAASVKEKPSEEVSP